MPLLALIAAPVSQINPGLPAMEDLAQLGASGARIVHLLSSGGSLVADHDMPIRLKNEAARGLRARLRGSVAEAALGKAWVGYQRPARADEVVVLEWDEPGFRLWWIDAGATGYLVARSPGVLVDPSYLPATHAFAEGRARAWLDLPAALPAPYAFYRHEQSQQWLHGYLAFPDEVQESLSLAQERDWIRSIGVWVGKHTIILQVPLPADEAPANPSATGGEARTGSRFDG
jgi:hypothetical protein